MIALRVLALLSAFLIIGCVLAYLGTRDRRWLSRAYAAFKWSLVAALVIFAIIIVERLLEPSVRPAPGKGGWPAESSIGTPHLVRAPGGR